MQSPIDHLPQTGPARLIVRVADDADASACFARVPDDSPIRAFDRTGATVPGLLAIEMAAQAAAVLEPRPAEGKPTTSSPRLLVGIRAVRLAQPTIPAECEYRCVVSALTTAPPLRIYRFEVFAPSGDTVAEGELSTFFDSEPA